MTSTQEELIRYRIEKRMAGRRDIILHIIVYLLVLALALINLPWWDTVSQVLFAILWGIPLALQFLRYYYQNGAGARKRAEEIEREIERQQELTQLDEDEELLIEERVSKKITARRWIVAHFLVMAPVLAVVWVQTAASWNFAYPPDYLVNQTGAWLAIFVLHWVRFYFVHGKTAVGRALKIEKEIERQWHLARGRTRERRLLLDATDDGGSVDDLLPHSQGRLRLTEEGELIDDITLEPAQRMRNKSRQQAQR